MQIAITLLVRRDRGIGALVSISRLRCSIETFGHGRQVVDHANRSAVDAWGGRFDVGDGKEFRPEIFDGIESRGGKAVILVDEGVAIRDR